jgi:hypothetical protein
MAAGQGFKTFNTGDVLTAADVNGYLMQGVLVFASTAARDAAITSPQEGQFAYTKDTNSLWYYTGSAWAASGATGDIEGVTAGVGISGGGTSGTVTITNDMATTITASGDIVVGTGSGTYDNLPIGTTNQVLTADTTVSPYKVKWATSAAGGMTVIASGTLSGSEVSITSIPSTYVNLLLFINNPYVNTSTSRINLRINEVTDGLYGRWFMQSNGSNGGDGASNTSWKLSDGTTNNITTSSTNYVSASILFPNYADTTTQKSMSFQIQDRASTYSSLGGTAGTAAATTSAISSIQIISQSNNFSGGTYTLYGVK